MTRKLPQSGGQHVHLYLAELKEIVERLRQSNLDGLGHSAAKLDAALDALSEATRHLQDRLELGEIDEALAGATPYLRLFALAAGGVYLALGALAEGEPQRAALCRFFAENFSGECVALKDRVICGAESLKAAAASLTTA